MDMYYVASLRWPAAAVVACAFAGYHLFRAGRAQSEFVATVSHDLHRPAVITATTMLEMNKGGINPATCVKTMVITGAPGG
jgi:hypothetical protein